MTGGMCEVRDQGHCDWALQDVTSVCSLPVPENIGEGYFQFPNGLKMVMLCLHCLIPSLV